MWPLASSQLVTGGSDMRPRASSSFCAAIRALTASRADCVIVMTRTTMQMTSARTSVPIIKKVMKPSCTLSTRSMEGLRPSIVSVIVVTLMMMVHTKKKQRQKEHDIATALSLDLAYGCDIASAQKTTRQTHVARMSWISVPA